MKKYLSFIVMIGIVAFILPVVASAVEIQTPPCEKVCDKPDANGKCQSICTIKVANNTSTMTEFNATLLIKGKGASIKSIQPGDGWNDLTSSTNGTSIPLSLIATNGVTTTNFLLATVTLELESSATDCSLTVSNPSIGKDVTVDITQTTTTQTKTGAALPIAIVACGACAAVFIYSTTKKSKKIYKI